MYWDCAYNSTRVKMYNEIKTLRRQRTNTNAYNSTVASFVNIEKTIHRKLHVIYGKHKK